MLRDQELARRGELLSTQGRVQTESSTCGGHRQAGASGLRGRWSILSGPKAERRGEGESWPGEQGLRKERLVQDQDRPPIASPVSSANLSGVGLNRAFSRPLLIILFTTTMLSSRPAPSSSRVLVTMHLPGILLSACLLSIPHHTFSASLAAVALEPRRRAQCRYSIKAHGPKLLT